MKKIFFLLILVNLRCSKNEIVELLPSTKTNANFIVYYDFGLDDFEKIISDTFEYTKLAFLALDTTQSTTYYWNIDGKKINYKKPKIDFSNYSKNEIKIELITERNGYLNDTQKKTIYLKHFPLTDQLKRTTIFQFINEFDSNDTLDLKIIRKSNSFFVDTILVNNCPQFPTMKPTYSINELAFYTTWFDSSSNCNSCKYIQLRKAFIKTDSINKNIVFLKFETNKKISNTVFESESKLYKFKGVKLN